MSTEAERAFLEYDWRNDTKWQEYLSGLYPTPPANMILRFKKKYYKKEVDPQFDVESKVGEKKDATTESTAATTPTAATGGAGYSGPVPGPLRPSLEKVATLHLMGALIFSVASVLPIGMAGRAYTVSLVAYIIGCMALICAHLGVPKFNMMWWSAASQLDPFQTVMVVMGGSSLKMFAAMLSPAIGAIQMIADSPSLGKLRVVKPYTDLVKSKRIDLSKTRAHLEVTTGFLLLVFCLLGRQRLLPVVLYWQTLRGRAMLNYYTRESFSTVNRHILQVLRHPSAPGLLLRGYEWIVSKVAAQ